MLLKEIKSKREIERVSVPVKQRSFVKKDIEHFILTHTSLPIITQMILEDMNLYQFQNYSSVNKIYDQHLKAYTSYELLSQVTLLDHTYHVAVEAIELTKSYPQTFRSIVILLALLHDFGKCIQIEKEYQRDENEPHHFISANYAKEKLQKYIFTNKEINGELIVTLFENLRNHHSTVAAKPNSFLDFLRKADYKAREKEIAYILKRSRCDG